MSDRFTRTESTRIQWPIFRPLAQCHGFRRINSDRRSALIFRKVGARIFIHIFISFPAKGVDLDTFDQYNGMQRPVSVAGIYLQETIALWRHR